MGAEPARQAEQLQLPMGVVTRSDAGRLVREAESVDNFLSQATLRQPGTAVQLPKTSNLFGELVSVNKLNMLQEEDRQLLIRFLQAVKTTAPVLHISFNTDPSPLFQQRLITSIRQQMHPFVLLQIGLHPSIGAGCVVRTTNKYYDFSLRKRFSDKRDLLVSKLHGERPAQPAPSVVKPEEATP